MRTGIILRTLLIGAVVATLALAPWWAGRGTMRLLVEIFTLLALAQLWNLLAGFAGLISVGQQAFVGLGGYVLFALIMFAGFPVVLALPTAALIVGVVAIPTAGLAFRLSGPYFTIGTWVIAEVFRLLAAQVGALGGGSGISLPIRALREMADGRAAREHLIYWLALAILVSVLLGVWALLRSRVGLGLAAMRDDVEAARASGVPIGRLRLWLFVGTAAMTALIGGLIFVQKLRITPEAAFSLNDWTVIVLFMTVIGGVGSLEGPILGCLFYFTFRENLADLGSWYMIALGAVTVIVMLIEPAGIWAMIRRILPVTIFPLTRRL